MKVVGQATNNGTDSIFVGDLGLVETDKGVIH